MGPSQLLIQLQRKDPRSPLASGYLFLGNELSSRDACRQALVERVFPSAEERERELVQYDLAEAPLEAVIEDARTLSLFTPARLIIACNAESALPRKEDSEEEAPDSGGQLLDSYFRSPTPGVVLLFEAIRYDWDERDEKRKLERLAKFFRAVPVPVEFHRLDARAVLETARALAQKTQVSIPDALLAELVEALGYDMARVAGEISKLAVYADGKQEITREVLAALVPEARTSGLFDLTDAMAARNRTRALEILDALTRRDVYLPLQVNFLAGLFRHSLAIKESGARTEGEVTRLFTRLGLPIWPARSRQALDTARRFSRQQLERAMVLLFETDRDLRQERPEDRLVMERLVWELTR